MTTRSDDDPLVLSLIELCRVHGVTVSADRLTDGLTGPGRPMQISDATRALRRVNMSCRVSKLAPPEIPDAAWPVLVGLKDGRMAVANRTGPDQVEVTLPLSGGGKLDWTLAELEAQHNGEVLVSKPLDIVSTRLNEREPDGQHWILGPVLKNWVIYRDVMLSAFVANLLTIGAALFTMQVYDRVVPNQAFDTLWILASGVMLAIALEFILRIMRARLIDVSGREIDLKLSAQLFEHVANLRLSHQPRSVGAFANQVRDFSVVREFFTSGTVAAISDLPFVLIFIGVLWFIGGPVALVVLAGAMLIVTPGILMQKTLGKASRQNTREAAALNGLLLETVSNLETVKAARAEERLQRSHMQLSAVIAGPAIKTRTISTVMGQMASSTQQITYALVVITGVYLIASGSLSMGGLIACTLLSSRTLAPMTNVAGLLARWQTVRAAMESLDKIMELPVERPAERHYVRAPVIAGSYEVTDARYSHDKESGEVLHVASLRIMAGERIALLGGNGAGKSTFLRLLAGLTQPSQGHVLLDNLSLTQIDPIDRRRQIGYLPQNVALLQGTLRDNLLLDHGLHSDEELLGALDAVGLGTHVRKHVRGLDLVIHSNGSVSGGQRQAIGLARVILQDPPIVILDEPTSAFDQVSEQRVVRFLDKWLKGRTTVIATHKRELLALTPRAVILNDGKIAHDDDLGKIVDLARSSVASQQMKVVHDAG